MDTDNLLQAYLTTHYHIRGIAHPLLIGHPSPEADALCTAEGATSWAFITAWNPMSQELPDADNAARNEQLRRDLAAYTVHTGRGQDPVGLWPAEESFFVIGIPRATAVRLAHTYRQRAIVVGVVGVPAELIETMTANGARLEGL
jgi:hypothetical protein